MVRDLTGHIIIRCLSNFVVHKKLGSFPRLTQGTQDFPGTFDRTTASQPSSAQAYSSSIPTLGPQNFRAHSQPSAFILRLRITKHWSNLLGEQLANILRLPWPAIIQNVLVLVLSPLILIQTQSSPVSSFQKN